MCTNGSLYIEQVSTIGNNFCLRPLWWEWMVTFRGCKARFILLELKNFQKGHCGRQWSEKVQKVWMRWIKKVKLWWSALIWVDNVKLFYHFYPFTFYHFYGPFFFNHSIQPLFKDRPLVKTNDLLQALFHMVHKSKETKNIIAQWHYSMPWEALLSLMTHWKIATKENLLLDMVWWSCNLSLGDSKLVLCLQKHPSIAFKRKVTRLSYCYRERNCTEKLYRNCSSRKSTYIHSFFILLKFFEIV